mgnify:CR=1 FL=1
MKKEYCRHGKKIYEEAVLTIYQPNKFKWVKAVNCKKCNAKILEYYNELSETDQKVAEKMDEIRKKINQ